MPRNSCAWSIGSVLVLYEQSVIGKRAYRSRDHGSTSENKGTDKLRVLAGCPWSADPTQSNLQLPTALWQCEPYSTHNISTRPIDLVMMNVPIISSWMPSQESGVTWGAHYGWCSGTQRVFLNCMQSVDVVIATNEFITFRHCTSDADNIPLLNTSRKIAMWVGIQPTGQGHVLGLFVLPTIIALKAISGRIRSSLITVVGNCIHMFLVLKRHFFISGIVFSQLTKTKLVALQIVKDLTFSVVTVSFLSALWMVGTARAQSAVSMRSPLSSSTYKEKTCLPDYRIRLNTTLHLGTHRCVTIGGGIYNSTMQGEVVRDIATYIPMYLYIHISIYVYVYLYKDMNIFTSYLYIDKYCTHMRHSWSQHFYKLLMVHDCSVGVELS